MNSSLIPVWLLAAGMAIAPSGCVPVHPSDHDLVGTWRVLWTCGTETLDLRPDATYTQDIEYRAGGRATHTGVWTVEPSESDLEGGHVLLKNAVEFCSTFGDKLAEPRQTDRRLEAIWEWGRVILSFNPDIEGFERQ